MRERPLIRYLLAVPVLFAVLFSSGCVSMGPLEADYWFRGNTHTHTLQSDGDTAPEVVAKWYHDRNYNFLIITDHNKFIDPNTVRLPEDRRDDFILIPGEEITGSRTIHTTAMNIKTRSGFLAVDLRQACRAYIRRFPDRVHWPRGKDSGYNQRGEGSLQDRPVNPVRPSQSDLYT